MKTKIYVLILLMASLSLSFFTGCDSCNKLKEKERDVIKIGAILPLTGKYADAGNTVLAGLTFAADSLNVHSEKYKYEIFSEDTRSEQSQVISAYRKVVDIDKASIVFTTTTAHVMAIKPQAIKDSIILFGIASHPDVTKDGNGFVFRPNNSTIEECASIGGFIKDKISSNQTIHIFYLNSEFGISFNQQLIEQLKGFTIISTPYEDDPSKVRNLISNDIKTNSTSYVVVIGFSPIMGTIIKTCREFNYKGIIVSNTGFFNPTIIEAAGDAANGIFYVDYDFPYEINSFLDSEALKKFKVHFSALSYISNFSLKVINLAINKSSNNNTAISNYLKNMGEITIDEMTFISYPDGNIKPHLILKEYRQK